MYVEQRVYGYYVFRLLLATYLPISSTLKVIAVNSIAKPQSSGSGAWTSNRELTLGV